MSLEKYEKFYWESEFALLGAVVVIDIQVSRPGSNKYSDYSSQKHLVMNTKKALIRCSDGAKRCWRRIKKSDLFSESDCNSRGAIGVEQ